MIASVSDPTSLGRMRSPNSVGNDGMQDAVNQWPSRNRAASSVETWLNNPA